MVDYADPSVAQRNLSITQTHQSRSAICLSHRSISRAAQSVDHTDPSVAQCNLSITQIHQSRSAICRSHRSISRAVQSVDHTDPSAAQRNLSITQIHQSRSVNNGRSENSSLCNLNVNKVDICYTIILI